MINFLRKDNVEGMTQEEIITYHLTKYGTITSIEAIKKYGITRLAAKVFKLRQSGLDIRTNLKQNKKQGTHAEYVLQVQ